MTIAPTLATYLEQAGIQPEVLTHPHSPSASRSAEASHVSGNRVAKAVLLKDETGYLLAVLPASHHLRLDAVEALTGRSLTLAAEDEIGRAFPDCEVGAVPPVGLAYGLRPSSMTESWRNRRSIWRAAIIPPCPRDPGRVCRAHAGAGSFSWQQ